jgi:AcrR family transcriptional regulator
MARIIYQALSRAATLAARNERLPGGCRPPVHLISSGQMAGSKSSVTRSGKAPSATGKSRPGGGPKTEQRVLREGARLFRKKGFAHTTTRELAAAVGVQSASLYYYVKTKEELLYRICDHGYDLMIGAVSRATEGIEPPLEALRAGVHSHLQTAIDNRDVYLTTLSEMRSLSPKHRQAILLKRAQYADLLVTLMEQAQGVGQIRSDIKASHLILVLRNTLSWTLFWFSEQGDLTVDELAEIMIDLFLHGAEAEHSPSLRRERDGSSPA